MEHRHLTAVMALLGALPALVLALLTSTAVSVVLPMSSAYATSNQCRYEGGPGAPTYSYCKAIDCMGRGGLAKCSVGVPAVQYGHTDDEVYQDKWLYSYDNGYSMAGIWAEWCHAANGTWDGDHLQCLNFDPDLLQPQLANREARAIDVADAFASIYVGSCGPAVLTSDTQWTQPQTSLGIDIAYDRVRSYTATNCSGGVDITFSRTRAAQCPANYLSRYSSVLGAQECYLPAECDACTGNPVSVITGTKYQREEDYAEPATGLNLSRYYDSGGYYWPEYLTPVGSEGTVKPTDVWRHSYDRRFLPVTGNSEVMAVLQRPDGSVLVFDTTGAQIANAGVGAGAHVQVAAGGGWDVTLANDDVEHYDASARLVSITARGRVTTLTYGGGGVATVTGPFGHTLTFGYTDGLLTSVTLPDQGVISYTYDEVHDTAKPRLMSVTYPDGTSRQYGYALSHKYPYLLSSITDESGQLFGTYGYDNSGRVTSESHAGGVEAFAFAYGASLGDATTVTDPLGAVTQHGGALGGGLYRRSSFSQACIRCGSTASSTYDTNGNPATRTDFNGHQTAYTFDTTRNLEISRTEASGTPNARTITTQWHPTFRLPTQIDEPGRQTTYSYDGNGNLLTRTVTDTVTNASRTWTYTYNGSGQVLTIDGPRTDVSDVTVFTYYSCTSGAACGQLASVTDAAGNLTTFTSYNADGQPLSMTDPNGAITTFAYDARQRLTSRTTAGETTTWEYWPTGQLKKATQPDGSFAAYDYDAAHRLVKTTDSTGNTINYTLDGAGNRAAETVRDAANTVVLVRTRTFNALGRVIEEQGSANQTTSYSYDTAGQVVETVDPFGRATEQSYDELGRLATITDPMLGLTQLGYDGLDNLVSVTDPRALVTSYAYNGLGDQTGLTSPDTGTTAYAYDAAGNLDLETDARNKSGDYSFDAAGRVSGIAYTDETIAFTYDQGSTGHGQLTTLTDGAGSTQWSYDSLGRVTARTQTTGAVTLTVGYGYDAAGRRASLTTPSGQTVGYNYDANGRIAGLTVNGTTLLGSVTYQPFGPIAGWQWGNATQTQRVYDTDGQLVSLSSAGSSTFSYFPDGRISARTDDFAGAAPGSPGTATFTTQASSNRVQSVTGLIGRTYGYDAAGHTTSDGSRTFTYTDAGRMKTSTAGGVTTTYSYSGLGERVKKTSATGTAYFAYDEAGHLVGEYDGGGNLVEETVWLDDIPVATLRPDGSGIKAYYVHTDQLNTPRRVTDPSTNTVIWRWESDPFGASEADEDPDGDQTTFVYNLRFPGQYHDAETGLNYNYFRDYDPVTGRYVESDPIGLDGGVNTYAYALGQPNRYDDPYGLEISEQWHNVVGPWYHTLIRITPCDQKAWERDPRFSNVDAKGRRYVTLGGGPSGLPGDLVNGYNRTKDARPHTDQIVLVEDSENCSCTDENEVIQRLLDLHDAYARHAPVNYDFFPERTGNYNSNSYASGLLDAAGIYKIKPPVPTPGWNTPVPNSMFH